MKTTKEKSGGIARSAGVVSSATLFSRISGLIREQVTAYLFGAGDTVDAFKSAFRLPNLLRDLFAEGALSAAFIPIFTEKLKLEGKDAAIRFAGLVFGAITAVVSLLVLLMILFTPQLVELIAGGFSNIAGKIETTVMLGRLVMPFLLLISLAALMMGILNSLGRFGIPALAPALLNLGIIVAAVALSTVVDPPILSLAIGVLLGGFLQFLLQYITLYRSGFRISLIFDLINPDLYRLLLLILPMTLGLAASQINVAIITRLASNESGAVAFLDYAFRLLHLPLGLFAVAIATVSLPRLSGKAAGGMAKDFAEIHSDALRLGILLSLPAAMLMIVLPQEICAAVFEYGRFTHDDTIQTARALVMYGIGMPFFALVRISVPAFYALKDTHTPAIISVISVAVNVTLCFVLRERFGFAGLALAASFAGMANLSLLTILLRRRITISADKKTLLYLAKVIIATFVTAAILMLLREQIATVAPPGLVGRLLLLIGYLAGSGSVFIAIGLFLRIDHLLKLTRLIIGRFKP